MPEEKKKPFLSVSRVIFYLLSIIVFFFMIRYMGNLKDIKKLLLQMNPVWIILVVVAQVATYLFNALMLRGLLKEKTGTATLTTLFNISVVIMFVNQVLPSGGISGSGYIFNQLVKRKIAAARAFTAIVYESLVYYVAFLLLLGGAYAWYWWYTPHFPATVTYTVLVGFVFIIALAIIMVLISNPRTIAFLMRKLGKYKKVRSYIEKVNMPGLLNEEESTFGFWKQNKSTVLQAVGWQLGILLLDVLTIYAIMSGFHIAMSPGRIVASFIFSLVVGSLPISPGSLIAYEGAMTYFFSLMGVPAHEGLAITLLFRFFSFWLPIPVGLFLYRYLQRERTEDFV